MTNLTRNLQVKRNLVTNVITLGVNVGIGIFYTPYLVSTLGIVAYGILPLAFLINHYSSVLSGSLTGAFSRFYTIAIQRNEGENASRYLSTSFFVMLGIIALVFLPLSFVLLQIEKVLNIPESFIADARLLFIFVFFGFVLSLITNVFNITLYAVNRLDLLNLIRIIRASFKFLFVLLFFKNISVGIHYVGLAVLLSESVALTVSYVFYLKKTSVVTKLSYQLVDKNVFYSVGAMASFTIIHQLGDLGIYRVDVLLVSQYWSTIESGIIAAIEELGKYTIILSTVISSLFGPLILIAYAKEDEKQVKELSLDRSLSVGVIVAALIGLLSGFGVIVLKLWLGESYSEYSPWLTLKLAFIPFYAAAGVFSFALRAMNKVRFPAFMTVAFGTVNFISLWIVANYVLGGASAIGIMLIIGTLIATVQSYFLNGFYFAYFYPGTIKTVLINFFKIGLVYFATYKLAVYLAGIGSSLSSTEIIIVMIISSLFSVLISLAITLNKNQKRSLLSIFIK